MLEVGQVYHANALDLLREMQVEGLTPKAIITDAMYGTAKELQYSWGIDPGRGDPVKHWAYHQPIYNASRQVLQSGGVLAWGQGLKFLNHFSTWFGGHRQWILAREAVTGYPSGNVWVVQTEDQMPIRFPDADAVAGCTPPQSLRKKHPCPKPVEELEFLVRHLTSPGDLVADIFCGLGSTLVACQRLGRQFIGCDLSLAYAREAKQRVAVERLKLSRGIQNGPSVPGNGTS